MSNAILIHSSDLPPWTAVDDGTLLLLLHLLSGIVWRLVGQLGELSMYITATWSPNSPSDP